VSGLYPNALSDAYPLSFSPITVLNQRAERHWLPHGLIPLDIPPRGSEEAGPPPDKQPAGVRGLRETCWGGIPYVAKI
jgi:hypothetical protein